MRKKIFFEKNLHVNSFKLKNEEIKITKEIEIKDLSERKNLSNTFHQIFQPHKIESNCYII